MQRLLPDPVVLGFINVYGYPMRVGYSGREYTVVSGKEQNVRDKNGSSKRVSIVQSSVFEFAECIAATQETFDLIRRTFGYVDFGKCAKTKSIKIFLDQLLALDTFIKYVIPIEERFTPSVFCWEDGAKSHVIARDCYGYKLEGYTELYAGLLNIECYDRKNHQRITFTQEIPNQFCSISNILLFFTFFLQPYEDPRDVPLKAIENYIDVMWSNPKFKEKQIH